MKEIKKNVLSEIIDELYRKKIVELQKGTNKPKKVFRWIITTVLSWIIGIILLPFVLISYIFVSLGFPIYYIGKGTMWIGAKFLEAVEAVSRYIGRHTERL